MADALIIAAGKGSRLNHNYLPKPLVPVQSMRLIEHIILGAKDAKIFDFTIVVGYKADLIRMELGSGEKYGVNIEYIFNPDWEKGNGISVYAAKDNFKDNFVLLMGDHIFDTAILQKLLHSGVNNQDSVLCIDSNLNGKHINLEDASKVCTENAKIRRIGKNLENFNAIDSGIFYYSSLIFRALETSIACGDDTLGGGNQVLSDWGKLKYMDITQHYWIDVDDPRDLQVAEEILFTINNSNRLVV